VIDLIIAPSTAPQVTSTSLARIEHPLALEVMDAVRQRGPRPVDA